VVRVNGSARPTTFVSATQLTATLSAADLAATGALAITVATPAPCTGATGGFCVSGSQSLTVSGPATASLTVSPGSGPPGSPLTVTLSNWTEGAIGWLAVAAVGTADTVYWQWIYVQDLPGTNGTRTWNTMMPAPAGIYEVRLFQGMGFTRLASSAPFTSEASAVSVSATTGFLRGPLTVTVTNWGGNPLDWLAVAPVGMPASTFLYWIPLGSLPGTGSTRTWATEMPGTPGTFEVRLFSNGGYTQLAVSPPITVSAP
jgi:hypothetical protein